MGSGQVVGLWAYIFFTWYVTVWHLVLPKYDEDPAYAKGYLAFVHCCFFLVGLSFYKTFRTDPGRVPEGLKLSEDAVYERKRQGLVRTCKQCGGAKPDRTHHCKKCNRCVLKMDHHCPWTLNCVGFRNYRFFVLILLWASIVISFVLVTQCGATWAVWQSPEKGTREYLILASFSMSAFQLCNVGPLFFFHLWLISNNMTTLEFLEKYRQAVDKPYENPFNVGIAQNWTQVFGRNPLLWFFPVNIEIPGDGMQFGTIDSEARTV